MDGSPELEDKFSPTQGHLCEKFFLMSNFMSTGIHFNPTIRSTGNFAKSF